MHRANVHWRHVQLIAAGVVAHSLHKFEVNIAAAVEMISLPHCFLSPAKKSARDFSMMLLYTVCQQPTHSNYCMRDRVLLL